MKRLKKWDDGYNFDDFKDAEKVVVSKNQTIKLSDGYTLAESPKQAIKILTNL